MTGLKYFGKTIKDDYHKYKGSGTVWTRHCNKHQWNYSTELIATFESDECEACSAFCLSFSEEHDIVKSKAWANIMPENGITGGPLFGEDNGMFGRKLTEEQRYACGNAFRGKLRPEHSKKMSGEHNPMHGRTDQCHGLIRHSLEIKGKTFEEIHGVDKAREMKAHLSSVRKGVGKSITTIICPHCGKEGANYNMARYHFDNCLSNPNVNADEELSKRKHKKKNKMKVMTCPHCGKVGSGGSMTRWHFGNCKHK